MKNYYKKRENEEFRENLIKSFQRDMWQDERVMNDRLLARMVDNDAICKCRLSRYAQQSAAVSRLTHRTEDYNEMQKAADTKNAGDMYDARNFDLEQNVAQIYFDAFGTGFYGEPYPSKDTEYTCRGCGLKMMMSLKTLPEHCPKCGRETPLGELYKERILKR